MSGPARFVHVGIHCGGPVPVERLEKRFETAIDWVRYDPSCWILYTTTELNTWRERIKDIIGPGNYVFLCVFDATEAGETYAGFMKKSVWDWLSQHRR